MFSEWPSILLMAVEQLIYLNTKSLSVRSSSITSSDSFKIGYVLSQTLLASTKVPNPIGFRDIYSPSGKIG